jgi:hypothetical protein
MRLSNGERLILIHFAMAYWLPAIGNVLFASAIVSSYLVMPLSTYAVLMMVVTPFLAIAMLRPLATILPPHRGRPRFQLVARLYNLARLPLAITTLGMSLVNLAAGATSYRYASTGISEGAPATLIVGIALYGLASADLFVCMFITPGSGHVTKTRRLATWLYAASILIGANGIATLFQALLAALYTIAPSQFQRLTLFPTTANFLQRVKLTIVGVVMLLLLFIPAWIGGQIVKTSSSEEMAAAAINVIGNVQDEQFRVSFPLYLLERLSSYYYAVLYTADDSAMLSSDEVNPVWYPIRNLIFRVDYLLGSPFGFERPAITSVSHLNYQLLSRMRASDREGSSPGVLASWNYVSPAPLGIFFSAAFLVLVARWIDRVAPRRRSPWSFVGCLLVAEALRGVFQSPFDLIIVADEGTLFLIAVWLLGLTEAERTLATPVAVPTGRLPVPTRPLVGSA